MLLNKRKRNPGQNLMNDWALVNNFSMFCPPSPPPPPPKGFNEPPEVCFELANLQCLLTGQSLRVLKS